MKLTKSVIAQFEAEQATHGSKLALSNLIWQLATDLLKDIGIRKVSTNYAQEQ